MQELSLAQETAGSAGGSMRSTGTSTMHGDDAGTLPTKVIDGVLHYVYGRD